MAHHTINLQELPRFGDKLTYLYAEHAVVDQEDHALAICKKEGVSLTPAAGLGVLLLGPGCSITHQAIHTLSENGCLVLWVGEHGVRYYAQGMGLARSSRNLQRQAMLASHPVGRLQVVVRMYCKRFEDKIDPGLTLQQLRGREGVRVRESYAQAAKEYGVDWQGRSYQRDNWDWSDPVNRALSAGNSCLYGLVQAAILSGGYSPGLGFVHCGKQLSFVYDIADLYKQELIIPMAFKMAAENPLPAAGVQPAHGVEPAPPGGEEKTDGIESRMRRACREVFRGGKLMERILPDIADVLDVKLEEQEIASEEYAEDGAMPTSWWSPTGFGPETSISEILKATMGG